MKPIHVRPTTEEDRSWIVPLLEEHWGSTRFVTRGRLFRADENPGFAAIKDEKPAGLITHHVENDQCEITSLNSLVEGEGICAALIKAVKDAAVEAGCKRLWVITTNDNTHAIRFYQKRGFSLSAVYPNALEQSRLLKPEIPYIGIDGIPLRDEIELELFLQD